MPEQTNDLNNTKPLFQGWEVWTDKANEIDEQVRDFLDPLYKQLVSENYSIRQATHVILSVVFSMEAETIITRNAHEYRKLNPRLKFRKEEDESNNH